jgi:hypothetical protein
LKFISRSDEAKHCSRIEKRDSTLCHRMKIKTIEIVIRVFQSIKTSERQTFEKKFYFYFRQRTEHEQDISIISNDVNSDSNLDDSNLSFAKVETHRRHY